MPPDYGDATHLKTLEKALKMVDVARFEAAAVSTEFDKHAGDLASLDLTASDYAGTRKRIPALEKPTFFVLEGGNGRKREKT